MTNAEAIERLDALRRENPMLLCADVKAIDMAISALEKQEGKGPITVETNIYDIEEIHHNCTVQVLRNSLTGEVSVGWWEEKEEEE